MPAGQGILHQIKVRLVGSDELSSVLKKATGSVENFKKAGEQMKSAGSKMLGVGVALGSALAGAVAPAMRLEESLANLSSVSTLPLDGSFKDMKTGMLAAKQTAQEWSSKHVQSAKEVTDAMYDLASAGLDVNQVNEVAAQTMALSTATRAEAAESSAMMAKALKTFGEAQLANLPIGERANAIMDSFAAVVKGAKITLPELGAALKSVMGTAANAGLTIQETSAAVGLLSTRGLPAEMAGTALSAVLRQLPKAAEKMGLAVSDASGRLLPLGDIVSQLTKRYAANGISVKEMAEISEVFGDEAGRAVQLLIGQEGALKDLTAAARTSGTAMGMVSLQEDSLGAQAKIAWNNIKGAAGILGDAMLPNLRSAAEWLGRAALGFKAFAKEHPTLVKIVGTLALASTAILVLGGGALYLAGSFAGTISSILSLSAAVAKAGGLLTVLKTGIMAVGRALLSLFLNPVGLVILGVVALGAGIYLHYKKSETFRNIVARVGAALKTTFMPALISVAYGVGYLVGTLTRAWQMVSQYTAEVWPLVSTYLVGFGKIVYAYLIPAIAFLKGYLVMAWDVIKTVTVASWEFVKLTIATVFNMIKNIVFIGWFVISGIFKAGMQILTGDWAGAWETIKQMFVNVWEGIKGYFGAVLGWFSGLGTIFYDAGVGLMTAFKDGIMATWESLKGGVTKVLGWIRDLLPGSDARRGPLSDLTASGKAFFPTFTKGIVQESDAPMRGVETALKDVTLAPGSIEMPAPRQRYESAPASSGNSLVVERGAIVINVTGTSEAVDDLETRLEELFARLNRRWGAAYGG
ncbi:MAG: phage tail tape measure protein [Thermoguttaceae bacterium]|nr:phage tail tape measure protein [Thermoguttaceae bacterium]